MDLLFKCRRQLLHCVISWAWFCLVLLGSSLSNSQSTLVWDTQPTSQTVETGSTVTFLCSATYESKVLQYRWKKDSGETIKTDSEPRFTVRDDGTLEITNVQVLDRGSYSCVVTRKDRTKVLGESNPATLTVRGVCAAVQLVTRPSGSTFLTGTTVQFRCKCYMNPPGTFAFVKDGSAVTEDSRITKDKHKLYINNATEKDSGTYSCSATSADSSVTKKPTEDLTISVVVGKGLQFLTSPPNKSVVLEGDQLSLPCTAVGNPGPLIKWYAGFDTSPLQNDSKYTMFENGTLQIKSVSKKEAKVYKCTAENMVGSIAKDTEVELAYLGDVTLEKAKVYVLINHRTEVLCGKPAGSPEPTITWEKADGGKLPDTFGVNGCCTLQKNRTKLKDSGRYTCVAKNIVRTSSKTIDIIVSERPRINIKPDDQNVKEGEPVSLDCSATSTPAAKIFWTKTTGGNQENIEKGILPNGTLLITKAQPSDSGTYRCSADHPGGWTDSAEAKVVVMCPTERIDAVSKKIEAVIFSNSTFSCLALDYYDTCRLEWFFNGNRLPSNSRDKYKIESAQISKCKKAFNLTVMNVTFIDKGSYSCRQWCGSEAFTAVTLLNVYGIPTAEVVPNPHPTLLEGDTLRLTCIVSESASEIKWKKNGDLLPWKAGSREGNKMVTLNVDTDDSGYYSCEAHNQAGFSSSSRSVEIRVRAFTAGKIFEWYYIVGPLSAVIIITFVSWYICKRRMTVRKAKAAIPDEELGYELEEMDHKVDKWEISRDRIVLRKVIGSGAFGVVWKGSLKEAGAGLKRQVIAAKCFTPTSGAEGRKALLKEIELGKQLQEEPQPNIITFVGCVTTRIHPILVMEYLPCGDLLGYLRKSRGIEDKYHCGEGEAAELSTYDLVSFARQIATGMVFLGSRGIIHRDLAARNVLLDKNCVCKITDFGLAYQNFKYGHGNAKKGRIPIKWTAPEILYGNPASLSSQSDVWSYGILLYEIFTIGGIPYPGWTEGRTIAEIKGGYRMPKPPHIDKTLYNVMTRCWHETPEFRPPFEPLRRKMTKYIEEELYTGLVDMAKYNGTQYSKVEDEGAQVAAEEPVKDELKKKLLAVKKWKSVRAEAGAKQESVTDGPKEKKLAKRKWQSVRAEAGAKEESVTDGPKEKRWPKRKWQSVRTEATKEETVG